MAKKGNRVIVTLECTEARELGVPPSRYTTTKNKKTTPHRLEFKKYNPSCVVTQFIKRSSRFFPSALWTSGPPLSTRDAPAFLDFFIIDIYPVE